MGGVKHTHHMWHYTVAYTVAPESADLASKIMGGLLGRWEGVEEPVGSL